MKNLNKIVKDIKKIEASDPSDLTDEIIVAFGDYNFKDKNTIIVSKDKSNSNIDIQAYIDHADSPIVCIQTVGTKVVDAWLS